MAETDKLLQQTNSKVYLNNSAPTKTVKNAYYAAIVFVFFESKSPLLRNYAEGKGCLLTLVYAKRH